MSSPANNSYLALVAPLGTLAGVIVGFLLNWWRDSLVRRNTLRQSKQKLASALLAESLALRERYMKVFGEHIAKWTKGQPLEIGGYLGVTNPFAVYDGNTAGLGQFDERDTVTIINAYTLAKSHAESITSVERKIQNYADEIRELRSTGYSMEEHKPAMLARSDLRAYIDEIGPVLQKESAEVLAAGDEAIKALRKYTAHRSGHPGKANSLPASPTGH
jgi:hypothetical protein